MNLAIRRKRNMATADHHHHHNSEWTTCSNSIGIQAEGSATFKNCVNVFVGPQNSPGSNDDEEGHRQSSSVVNTGFFAYKPVFNSDVTVQGVHDHGGQRFLITNEPSKKIRRQCTSIFFNIQDPVDPIGGQVDSDKKSSSGSRLEFIENLHQKLQNSDYSKNSNFDTPAKTRPSVLSHLKIIVGPQGTGKSEVVRMYISRYKNVYDNVIWIEAGSYESMKNCFLGLAAKLKIFKKNQASRRRPDFDSVLQKVYDKLVGSGTTLVVFDGAESYRDPPSSSSQLKSNAFVRNFNKKIENVARSSSLSKRGIKPFLPSSLKWQQRPLYIVVTSRTLDWGVLDKNVITLAGFNLADSLRFVLKRVRCLNDHGDDDDTQKEALELVNRIGNSPLVLTRAMMAMRKNFQLKKFTNSMTSRPISDYLKILDLEMPSASHK